MQIRQKECHDMTVQIGVGFLPKERNNSPTNLATGLVAGFTEAGIACKRIEIAGSRVIDPSSLQKCDALVVPYWIHRDLFNINLGDVRAQLGDQFTIITYTGVGPYWNGCPWVTHGPVRDDGHSTLVPGATATQAECDALEAVSCFAVVAHRDNDAIPDREVAVGMGIHAELSAPNGACKFDTPAIVLDFFKPDWDENVFAAAVAAIADARERVPELMVLVMGSDTCDRAVAVDQRAAHWGCMVSNTFTNFEVMVEVYRGAWGIVIHNESFGFTAHEAAACGSQVFCSAAAEVPSMYYEFCDVWTHPSALTEMIVARANGGRPALAPNSRWETMAHRLRLDSWAETARAITRIATEGIIR